MARFDWPGDATMRGQVSEGLAYVARHPLLRWTAVYTGASNAVGAALNVVLVLFEARVMHFSAGTIGVVFLLGNVGFVIGAPMVRRVTARLGMGRTMLLAALMSGAAPALFPMARAADAVPVIVVGWFFRALASPFYGVNQISLRLAITPTPMLARMTATMKFFVMGAMPVGSFLGGALAGTVGSRATLWVIAAVSALSVLAVGATKLRAVSTAPEDLHPERSSGACAPVPVCGLARPRGAGDAFATGGASCHRRGSLGCLHDVDIGGSPAARPGSGPKAAKG